MSTPLYIKETTLGEVSNSRISEGCALLFYLDGNLKMKFPNGSIKDAMGGGADVKRFVISRPISDKSLYPKIMASQTGDFLSTLEIDPLNNEGDKTYFQIFDGNEWVAFPNEDGLGTPFDRMEVSVDISKFSSLTQPYYIKYCWVESDGTESNLRSSLFPSVSVSTSLSTSSNGGNNSNGGCNVVLSPTQPTDLYDGLIWIQTTSVDDVEYADIETISVVKGTTEPSNAANGTIFIKE